MEELEKFKKEQNKNSLISLIMILLIIGLLVYAFFIFNEERVNYDVFNELIEVKNKEYTSLNE